MRRTAGRQLLQAPSEVSARERRIESVMSLVERFMYDLGSMAAGRDDELDGYVSAAVVVAMRAAVQPFLSGELSLQPDFGEYAQLSIEGDLLDENASLTVRVEFENRSTVSAADGTVVTLPRRALRLTLVTDPAVRTVVAQRLEAPDR